MAWAFTKPHIYFDLDAFHPLCCETREVQVQTGAAVAMTQRVLELLGPLDTGYYNVNNDIEHCLWPRRAGSAQLHLRRLDRLSLDQPLRAGAIRGTRRRRGHVLGSLGAKRRD